VTARSQLMLSLNGAKATAVPVFYTVGWWNQTQPLLVNLVKGNNTVTFSRSSGRELVFKEFFLYQKEPVSLLHNGWMVCFFHAECCTCCAWAVVD